MNRGRCMLLGSTSQRRWSMPTNLATLTSTGYVWMPGPRNPGETLGLLQGALFDWLGFRCFFFFVSLLSTWRKLIVFLCFSHLFLTHLFVFSLVCNPPKPSKSPAPRVSTDIQESKRLSDVFLCSSVLDHHWPGAVRAVPGPSAGQLLWSELFRCHRGKDVDRLLHDKVWPCLAHGNHRTSMNLRRSHGKQCCSHQEALLW